MLTDRLQTSLRTCFRPIDNASLVYYRLAFGAIALWEVWSYYSKGFIKSLFIDPTFYVHYHFFEWVHPWPGDGMYWHFGVLGVAASCMIVGLFYRLATAVYFLGFTYVFLLDKTYYLNHHYLFCMLCFWMIWIPAHRGLSLDALFRPSLRSRTAPAWCLYLLRFMMGLVYVYAAVAKMNADWFSGWPMRMMLTEARDFPVLGPYFGQVWCQLAFAYSGLLLDLLVVPGLLWRRTRPFAFGLITCFHLMNAGLFDIGVFPWMSILTTLLFFSPNWPRRLFGRSSKSAPVPDSPAAPAHLTARQRCFATFLLAFAAIQILLPLRHWLYPGNVHWTEEGHAFAWHMKLRIKHGRAEFNIVDPRDPSARPRRVNNSDYLTFLQDRLMSTRPDSILQFARFLADEHSTPDHRVQVFVKAYGSLNGRLHQLLVDPEYDMANERLTMWHKPWILPLETPLPPNRDENDKEAEP